MVVTKEKIMSRVNINQVQRTMTTVEKILVTGTLGICTGVWITLLLSQVV